MRTYCPKNTSYHCRGAPDEEIEPDQGYTRPALLILTPFRSQAFKWLSALSSSLPGKIEGEDRYKREFGLPEGASDKLADAPKGTYAEDHVEVRVYAEYSI